MFRTLVSRLSFSPALVGQLSFYAKRLRNEQTTRRLGLIFVALALVVQSLVVFQAPQSANAASSNDFVYGGLGLGSNRSLNNFLNPYDANTKYLKDIMTSFGITRAEIATAQYGSFSPQGHNSWGREPRSFDAGSLKVYNPSWQQVATVYGRPMTKMYKSSATIYGYIGNSKAVGWFAVMQDCGNLVTTYIPDSPTPPEPPKAPARLELSKKAVNLSQGAIDATKSTAKASDRITYTVTIRNGGGTAHEAIFSDHLGDVLEYATLIDNGGGSYNSTTKTLSWPAITLGAGETASRAYMVKILGTIPATPKGTSDPTSYDCRIENVFGTGTTVPVACETPKVVETVVQELPKTGPTENVLFGSILLAVVTYFYFRSKQMNKEVRVIRRDLNAGTL